MRLKFITQDLFSALNPSASKIKIANTKKKGELRLHHKELKETKAKLNIYNFLGEKLKEQDLFFKEGRSSFKPDLPVGLYILSFLFDNGNRSSIKLNIKRKKPKHKSLG